jgi:hypothetical protein
MGTRHSGSRLLIGLSLAFMMLVAGPAASALATTKVRLIDARAGSPALKLVVKVGSASMPAGEASFGQVAPYARVPPGSAQLDVSGPGVSAQATEQLADGANYTAVVLAQGAKGYSLMVYKDGAAKAGSARLRVLHAAPELGAPDVKLGKRTIAVAVHFRTASPYLTVAPGSYTLSVTRPGGSQAIFSKDISLAAGVATTAVLAGSGGARERLIVATDDTKAPAGAPETGLGGLAGDGGPPWLLIALSALLAGALGGVAQLSLARRSGRR